MGKYVFTFLLAAMSVLSGIAFIVYRSNPRAAIVLGILWGLFGILALIAAVYESLPKPHLVPLGYGHNLGTPHGILLANDGEPAYNVTPPKSIKFGKVGTTELIFEDPEVARLAKEQEPQCFVVSVRDSTGHQIYSDLRMKLAMSGADFILAPFRYADGKKPRRLRYTTICKIELKSTGSGIMVTPFAFRFKWWRLLW